MNDRSMERLVERSRAKDSAAFAELVDLVDGRVRAVILSRQQAFGTDLDDVLQETWHRALNRIVSMEWRGERALVSWLSGIAINVAREAQAKAQRARYEPIEDRHPCDDPTPSRNARRAERFERLEASLRALSPEHRRVILEARIHKKPIWVIAEEMERSAAAVSQMLLRALRKLREEFGDTGSLGLPARRLGPEIAPDE